MIRSFADVFRRFAPGDVVYLAGCCGEPTAAIDALRADPELGRDLIVTGVFIPGFNRIDYPALAPGMHARSFFVTPDLRASFAAGAVDFLPLHYSAIDRYLRAPAGLAGAIFQVSPPDRHGEVSLGISGDFTPAAVDAGVPLFGQINPAMPAPPAAPRVAADRFSALIEAETPLLHYQTGPVPAAVATIGAQIAALVRPGDTVQFGIGKVQAGVLAELAHHRDLGFHSGMIADEILPLLDAGVFPNGITTGVALGHDALYQRAAVDDRIRFAPVSHTHDRAVIGAIDRFVAINSVLEVDLFGQANAEMLGDQQISGSGGLADFVIGARASPGGRALLALPATAAKGARSRIVAKLGGVTTIARTDTDLVVTEHGVADLRWRTIDQRAEALIAIAAPAFRDQLADQWVMIRRKM